MSHSSPSSTTRLKVFLIGSNPSIKSQSDFAFFLDTKSGQTLQRWISEIKADFHYGNVSATKTENNRPLTRVEIKTSLPTLLETIARNQPDKIVALGKAAHEALNLLKISHLEMPHPSGKNFKLNNKAYRDQKINELVAFCTTSSSSNSEEVTASTQGQ